MQYYCVFFTCSPQPDCRRAFGLLVFMIYSLHYFCLYNSVWEMVHKPPLCIFVKLIALLLYSRDTIDFITATIIDRINGIIRTIIFILAEIFTPASASRGTSALLHWCLLVDWFSSTCICISIKSWILHSWPSTLIDPVKVEVHHAATASTYEWIL